jgi:hypothetical protein
MMSSQLITNHGKETQHPPLHTMEKPPFSTRKIDGRIYFGAKLTSLMTTVNAMQDELFEEIQLEDHHPDDVAAMEGLHDIQDSIKTLAELLGRTRSLPRIMGAISMDFYTARSMLTGNLASPQSDPEPPAQADLDPAQDPFRDFSGSWERYESLILEGTCQGPRYQSVDSIVALQTESSEASEDPNDNTGDGDGDGEFYPAMEYQTHDQATYSSRKGADPAGVEVPGFYYRTLQPSPPPERPIKEQTAASTAPEVRDTDSQRRPKMKMNRRGDCPSCGPASKGTVFKGRLWCNKCGLELDE